MFALKESYVVDEKGNRVGVILDWATYQQMLEALEELEAIRAYDASQEDNEVIPFEQAVAEIEQNR